MFKVIADLFPNLHKANKEMLMKLKLYNYCLLTEKEENNAFDVAGSIANIISKHQLTSTD